MAKVSYVVTVNNQEQYIGKVIDSLKTLKGSFRKEFIFINDGSTDKSLEVIKNHAKELPNTTIISHKYKGNSTSSNEGVFLAQGDYINFIYGNDILDPDSTVNLLDSLSKHGHRVAFGMLGKYDLKTNKKIPSSKKSNEIVIKNPLSELLKSKDNPIKLIGASASLVSRDLIEEISAKDNEIFVQDFSLALRCAAKSNFVFCPKTICYTPLKNSSEELGTFKKLEAYKSLMAIRKFIDYDPLVAERHRKEIYASVMTAIWRNKGDKLTFLPKYLASKIYISNYTLDDLKNLIDKTLKNFL